MKLKIAFSLLIITFLISSCYYDKEDYLYGATKCDTANVKYSVQVISILNSNCISCHGGTAANGGGIKLGTYADIKVYTDNGALLNSITRTTNTMPKGGARLSDCRIAEIRTWIRNGAPNN
jgi:mono/diheme cytochrome c family protein